MITKRNLWLLAVMFIAVISSDAQSGQYDIVPMPQSIELQKGEPFVLETGVQILAPAELQGEVEFLKQYLKEMTGNDLPVVSQRAKKVRYIELALSPKVQEKEGYVLTVNSRGILIQGGTAAGVFYGIQTLRKAMTQGNAFPAVVITDAPRFSWRGMHLDCSRHFFTVAFIK